MVTVVAEELIPTHPTIMAFGLTVVSPDTVAAVTSVAEDPVTDAVSSGAPGSPGPRARAPR